jgi:hypothetical protein
MPGAKPLEVQLTVPLQTQISLNSPPPRIDPERSEICAANEHDAGLEAPATRWRQVHVCSGRGDQQG